METTDYLLERFSYKRYMLKHLSFKWPVANDPIRESIIAAIDDGDWGAYHGRYTSELSTQLQQWLSLKHALLCCSGTAAVELALRGVGVSAGDEVILAAYDFPGNFRAIEAIGATPVLVDVRAGGWVVEPKDVATACSEKTKAILVSHLHGQFADIPKIKSLIETAGHSIPIVEDACQSPGGIWLGHLLGTLGDVGVFSFGGSKLLSAGRGGAIVTNDDSIAQRIKVFSERGNDSFPLSQLQAAALLPQLSALESFTSQRFEAAQFLCEQINQIKGVTTLDLATGRGEDSESQIINAIYKIPIRVDTNFGNLETLTARLQADGLPIGTGFRGFYRRSKRRCRKPVELPNSTIAAEQTLLISHPVLMHDHKTLELIVECLEQVLR
ncbi:DegT/DnrJ/EryC1/StrS aminotransferase family protein [Mariniblastus sp.]|nr:DegT/DnrJ/EryC1/StrS aminotransferase family protein [Mariniblastus sp.]